MTQMRIFYSALRIKKDFTDIPSLFSELIFLQNGFLEDSAHGMKPESHQTHISNLMQRLAERLCTA